MATFLPHQGPATLDHAHDLNSIWLFHRSQLPYKHTSRLNHTQFLFNYFDVQYVFNMPGFCMTPEV